METEKKTLFRKKSLEKLTSPEELGDYIRVAKPRIWITLGAIVALLLAGILWACFYTITRAVECGGYVYADYVYIYLSPDDYERVSEGDAVNIGGADYTVTLKAGMLSGAAVYAEWSARGVSEADVNVYMGVANSADSYYGAVTVLAADLPEGGGAACSIVYEEISPIGLVLGV